VAHDLLPERGMFREEAEGEQVMGLAAAHRLAEQEGAGSALRLPLQTGKRLAEELAHPLGDVVFGEELTWVDLVEVVDVVDGVPHRWVEHRRSRHASLLEGRDHPSIPVWNCSLSPIIG